MTQSYDNIQKKLKKIDVGSFTSPISFIPYPASDDYNNGYINRFFCKKVNDGIIIEIDNEQYDSLSNKEELGINYFLYQPYTLKWRISGPKNDIYKENIRIKNGVEDTNNRILSKAEKEFSGISKKLNNPLQFFIEKI